MKKGYGLKSFAWKGRIISSIIIPPEITILPSLHNHGQAPAEMPAFCRLTGEIALK